ncbi:MAG: hypothetical protein ACLFQ8_03255 [Candidatus Aenigmatarchaeota archaeon]
MSNEYQVVDHLDEKESTGKWFLILLLPAIILVAGGSAIFAETAVGTRGGMVGGAFGFISFIVAPLAALYLLYKVSIPVSGHEKRYGDKERVVHMDKKESTVKWMMFGITGALSIYYLWKGSEMVSGHEVVR